jgi:hypothetical protein
MLLKYGYFCVVKMYISKSRFCVNAVNPKLNINLKIHGYTSCLNGLSSLTAMVIYRGVYALMQYSMVCHDTSVLYKLLSFNYPLK